MSSEGTDARGLDEALPGADAEARPAPRRTFVVHVREPGSGVVVEDVHLRRRARLGSLSELPERIASWLDAGWEPDSALTTGEKA